MSATKNSTFRYDDRVVVITGAGGAIGSAYALEFARRGAKVVVNDFGTSSLGEQETEGTSPADKVVAEIKSHGGEAIANYSSVESGQEIIEQALDSYGQIDVLINNAGISFPVEFSDITLEQWHTMLRVHVDGSFICTKAAWPQMLKRNYGRIILTASPAMYGADKLSHYATAKSAMPGFAGSLAAEGASANIHCNTVAPTAMSRMISEALPAKFVSTLDLDPNDIAQLAAWLCHETNQENSALYEVGGKFIAKIKLAHSKGLKFDSGNFSAETIAQNQKEVEDFSEPFFPETPFDMTKRTGLDMAHLADSAYE